MRIVIPANGNDLNASTSPTFGRCGTFVFVDTETLACEALPNPGQSAPGGAGIEAAQFVLQHGAQAVITGQLGPNAFRVFQAANVPMYQLAGTTVRDVVTAFNAGQLPAMNETSAQRRSPRFS